MKISPIGVIVVNIVVCVGNSCHAKGSCDVIRGFQELIRKYRLEDVAVNASFCTGHCTHRGVFVQIDDDVVEGVTAENLKGIFSRYVLKPAACAVK